MRILNKRRVAGVLLLPILALTGCQWVEGHEFNARWEWPGYGDIVFYQKQTFFLANVWANNCNRNLDCMTAYMENINLDWWVAENFADDVWWRLWHERHYPQDWRVVAGQVLDQIIYYAGYSPIDCFRINSGINGEPITDSNIYIAWVADEDPRCGLDSYNTGNDIR